MTFRYSVITAIFMAFLLVVACGDDENNPQGGGTNPTASTLGIAVDQNTITLTWDQCPDTDFASYNLYRSTASGIAANPASATLVATLTTAATLTHVDSGLEWNTPYYYALQTVNSSQLTSWSNEATITTADSSGGGGGGGVLSCFDIQGQADESPYAGDDVTVTGIVTVAGDEFYAGSGTAAYAVIQDAAGSEWSGLLLYGYDGVLDNLERGDSVVVSGYVSEYTGPSSAPWELPVTEVVVQSVDYNDPGHTIPSAVAIQTADIELEKWEGVLVKFQNVTVTDADLGFGEWMVDDGSGDARIDDMGIYGYTVNLGDTFSEIIGVGMYSFDYYKLEPRDESDITQ